jgi:glycosyltransferase involved in cell wall biosynthesis
LTASLSLAQDALERLRAADAPVVVLVSHAWGGGIRRHVDDLEALLRADCRVLHLQPGPGGSVHLHGGRHEPALSLFFALPAELGLLSDTLRAAGVARLHFHHLHGLPRSMLDLPSALGAPFDVTLHDYYGLCWHAHFGDASGRYCGDPEGLPCTGCGASRSGTWGLALGEWRELFRGFMARAARVIAPSEDVARRYRQYWPELAVDVWPHPETQALAASRPVRAVVVGRISPEKGLHVLGACAADAAARRLPLAFRIVGCTTEPLPQAPLLPLTISGEYRDDALPALLAAEAPRCPRRMATR